MAQNPIVTITMENGDVIKAELYPDVAPITVNNFLSLVNRRFYDGLIFHRVIRGFMIQGGDPEGTGMGGPGYCIKGEFAQNGVKNDLKHTEGVLSMARAMAPNSAGSQFFIMHKTSPHLDGAYAAFGKVIEGMENVNKIAETRTDYSDRPLAEQRIRSMTAGNLRRGVSGTGENVKGRLFLQNQDLAARHRGGAPGRTGRSAVHILFIFLLKKLHPACGILLLPAVILNA